MIASCSSHRWESDKILRV